MDIETEAPNKKTLLHCAIAFDRKELFAWLLENGADPNHLSIEHPLLTALLHGRSTMVEPLLKAGADQSLVPGILELAACRNDLDSIKLLMEKGADIEGVPSSGWTSLQTSIRDNRREIFEWLLAHGANPNHQGTNYPIWTAIECRRVDYIEPLIKAGADLKLIPGLIELTTWQNNLDIIKMLVNHGCDVNETPVSGWIALQTAIRDSREDIFDWLLLNGADPNLPGTQYPLTTAVHLQRLPFISKLLDAGADTKLAMKSLLVHSVWLGDLEMVKILLDSGKFDINELHSDGSTALTMAIRQQRMPFIELLLSKGADPNAFGVGLPLVVAAGMDDGPEILQLLLKAGADPNLEEQQSGKTALLEAAGNGRVEKIKMLIASGANAESVNKRGQTALDVAAEKGHDEVVMILLEGME
jgi:ankyrin repeat protein